MEEEFVESCVDGCNVLAVILLFPTTEHAEVSVSMSERVREVANSIS
jgi:hypothetical protein